MDDPEEKTTYYPVRAGHEDYAVSTKNGSGSAALGDPTAPRPAPRPAAPHVDTPLERAQKHIARALDALKVKGARVALALHPDERAAVTEHLKDKLVSPADGSDEAAIKRLLAGEEVQA